MDIEKIFLVLTAFGSFSFISFLGTRIAYKMISKDLDAQILKEKNKNLILESPSIKDYLSLENNVNEKDMEKIITERYANGDINEEEYIKALDIILRNENKKEKDDG